MLAVPSDALDLGSIRHAYDAVADELAVVLPDTRAEAALDLAMVDAFAEAVTTTKDASVLDAGCGAGRMSRYLADRGCRVDGVDLSEGLVARAHDAHGDLRFAVGSLTALPYRADRFAGVLLWYSTIHLPEAGLAHAFAEAARVVRPGGHVLVGFQAGEGTRKVAFSYSRFRDRLRLNRHLRAPDDVSKALAAAGLREVSRLVRPPQGKELDDQSFLLARAD